MVLPHIQRRVPTVTCDQAAKLLTEDEARRIAANIAKLPFGCKNKQALNQRLIESRRRGHILTRRRLTERLTAQANPFVRLRHNAPPTGHGNNLSNQRRGFGGFDGR
jgi:hypothetical protein